MILGWSTKEISMLLEKNVVTLEAIEKSWYRLENSYLEMAVPSLDNPISCP